jgi:coenzyme F420-0:L-glutamate ligase
VTELRVLAPEGAPEITPGADLAELVVSLLELRDGDVVVVTSKAVAKAEGRVTDRPYDQLLAEETDRVVARRESLAIVRHRLGLTLAAAGIDGSNVREGHLVPLPLDPDASARRLRISLRERTGANVGVVVTDTAGRAWRVGQTDLAVGAAGLVVLESYAGRTDGYGHELKVTEPAAADELAGAAELAQGKLGRRPFARIRGRADLVLGAGEHGAGAVALVRPEEEDLFGLGVREAVVRALVGDPADAPAYGAVASRAEIAAAFRAVLGSQAVVEKGAGLGVDGPARVVAALAFAHGWTATGESGEVTVRPPAVP